MSLKNLDLQWYRLQHQLWPLAIGLLDFPLFILRYCGMLHTAALYKYTLLND